MLLPDVADRSLCQIIQYTWLLLFVYMSGKNMKGSGDLMGMRVERKGDCNRSSATELGRTWSPVWRSGGRGKICN